MWHEEMFYAFVVGCPVFYLFLWIMVVVLFIWHLLWESSLFIVFSESMQLYICFSVLISSQGKVFWKQLVTIHLMCIVLHNKLILDLLFRWNCF